MKIIEPEQIYNFEKANVEKYNELFGMANVRNKARESSSEGYNHVLKMNSNKIELVNLRSSIQIKEPIETPCTREHESLP